MPAIKVKYSRGLFKYFITSADTPELGTGEKQQHTAPQSFHRLEFLLGWAMEHTTLTGYSLMN